MLRLLSLIYISKSIYCTVYSGSLKFKLLFPLNREICRQKNEKNFTQSNKLEYYRQFGSAHVKMNIFKCISREIPQKIRKKKNTQLKIHKICCSNLIYVWLMYCHTIYRNGIKSTTNAKTLHIFHENVAKYFYFFLFAKTFNKNFHGRSKVNIIKKYFD